MRTTSVREATARDLPRILEIERLAFPQPWSLESFKRELILPFSRIMVVDQVPAESGGQVAGFLCRWLIVDECHILNLAVHPELRRGGIGKVLMAEAINEAKAKDIRMSDARGAALNVAARSLYRKLNFEERRLRSNYYGPGEDAIVMELALGPAPK